MATTRQKGDSAELRLKRLYEDQGWSVCRASRKFMKIRQGWVSRENDFFGLFDLICVGHHRNPQLIQVTSGESEGNTPKKRKAIQEWMGRRNLKVECLVIMWRTDIKRWVQWYPCSGEWFRTVYTTRELESDIRVRSAQTVGLTSPSAVTGSAEGGS